MGQVLASEENGYTTPREERLAQIRMDIGQGRHEGVGHILACAVSLDRETGSDHKGFSSFPSLLQPVDINDVAGLDLAL